MKTDWYEVSKEMVDIFFDINGQYTEDDSVRVTSNLLRELHVFFESVVRDKRIKDTWCNPQAMLVPHQTELIEKSSKTKSEISLGVGSQGYFVEAVIAHPEFLHRMKDDYWALIAGLKELGSVELHDHGRPIEMGTSVVDKELLKFESSVVFQIIRDFIMSKQCQDLNSGIGSISIAAPLDSNRKVVTTLFSEGIVRLHKINYLAYRLYYINMKQQEKKIEKETGHKVKLV